MIDGQTVKANAEISRLLYQKAEELEDREYEIALKEEVLAHWEYRLTRREVAYNRKKKLLVVYEANLKIRRINAKKTKQENIKK